MINVPQIAALAKGDPILYEALRRLATLSSPDVPAGMISYTASPTAPDGYVFADGRQLKRAENQRLFAAIGTRYGAADGTTTFNVPNLVPEGTVSGMPNIVAVIKL